MFRYFLHFRFLWIFIFLIHISITSTGQEEEELFFAGKWQEYKRTEGKKRKAREIELENIIMIEFMADSTGRLWYEDGKFCMGPIEIDEKGFHIDRELFDFYEINENEVNLGRNNIVHHFHRVDQFTAMGPIRKVIPDVEEGPISASKRTGKWSAYKKTDPQFKRTNFYLRDLEILEPAVDGKYPVKLSYASQSDVEKTEAIMHVEKDKMYFLIENRPIELRILKWENNELILQDGDIHYYLKDFSQD